MEVRYRNVKVTCLDPQASADHALAIARVFGKNWLDECPDNEPVQVSVDDVSYRVEQEFLS